MAGCQRRLTIVGPHGRRPITISKRNLSGLSACRWLRAPATINDEGLADVEAANPFRLPRNHRGIGSLWAWLKVVGALRVRQLDLFRREQADLPHDGSRIPVVGVTPDLSGLEFEDRHAAR